MSTPHLLPAAAAVLIVAAVLGAGYRHARAVERRSIRAVAAELVPDMAQRRALQLEASRKRDLLLLYGSSELLIDDPYHVTPLFRDQPTGFAVVPVGQKAGCSVLHVQHLAALGQALRGRKVALSFTANSFFERKAIAPATYAGNFSRLNANELAFSGDLSFGVKREVARRMLDYPGPLEQDPLLEFAVRQLAEDSVAGRALYYAALPLGRLQAGVLRLQDHWDDVGFVKQRQRAPDPGGEAPALPSPVDWPALAARAERDYRTHNDNNPFGFDNQVWRERFQGRVPPSPDREKDAFMRRSLETAPEWDDLETLLRALHELGAEPLLLVTPIKGNYFDRTCIFPETRRAYYERMRAVGRAHGVPVVEFAEHDLDRDFLIDASHLSSKGWVYYAYALDGFFHGRGGPDLVLRPGLVPPGDYPRAVGVPPLGGLPRSRTTGRRKPPQGGTPTAGVNPPAGLRTQR